MADELTRIPFEEFSGNLVRIFERVIHDHEAILVEGTNGELVEVKPATLAKSRRRAKTSEDHAAFLAALGGWKEIDVDAFLTDNEESRSISTRLPVEL